MKNEVFKRLRVDLPTARARMVAMYGRKMFLRWVYDLYLRCEKETERVPDVLEIRVLPQEIGEGIYSRFVEAQYFTLLEYIGMARIYHGNPARHERRSYIICVPLTLLILRPLIEAIKFRLKQIDLPSQIETEPSKD